MTNEEFLKILGQPQPDCDVAALKARIAALEKENQELREETVRIYETLYALYRAVKQANMKLDAIEEKCDNTEWFRKIKERTY